MLDQWIGNMAKKEKYVVILPYYCQEEVDRYVLIANWLREKCKTPLPCHFLLAASPKAKNSEQLYEAFSDLGECSSFQCPTQIFGYPEGPTAMFWDAMDYIAEHFGDHEGFSLWLESDMSFTQPNWLPRLAEDWFADNETPPLLMGCYVPEVYKRRFFRKPKLLLTDHINGGACYSLDFAKRMPQAAREGCFDMSVYQYGKEIGGMKTTELISFSTLKRVRRDLLDTSKCILHGFMQDKNQFIDACVKPITAWEQRSSSLIPVRDQMEVLGRRIKVRFVRRGHQAMLENMLLAQHNRKTSKKAA